MAKLTAAQAMSLRPKLEAEVRRRAARAGLLAFTEYTKPDYSAARHHRLICEKLEAVERGEIDRLMIACPPRHGKSELASRRYVAWYLARNSAKQVICGSYNQELADDFGKDVRDIIQSDEYKELCGPNWGCALRKDSQAASRWRTDEGGLYFAAGVGSGISGRGADLLIIDDPHKDRADADSLTMRNDVWEWYRSTAYMRLMPGGAVILIQCMTGDTPVLMADGAEKSLRDISVGDEIATYDNGRLSTSFVRNKRSNGPDSCFTLRTIHGLMRGGCNGKHPFLVNLDGVPTWIKMKDLRPGHKIYRVNGANGRANPANRKGAKNPSYAGGIATPITTRKGGQTGLDHHRLILQRSVSRISSTVMELLSRITPSSLMSRMESVLSAFSLPAPIMFLPVGAASSVLTTATIAERLEAFSATNAIKRSVPQRPKKPRLPLLSTSDFIPDEILEIIEIGVEEVFDIQVDRTENFMADSIVSSNTRWHEDDLAGRLLSQESGDKWDLLSLPAFAEANDQLGREVGEALWPEWFDADDLERKRNVTGPREWSALYQQSPTPEGGLFFREEDICWYDKAPLYLHKYGASDYAVTADGGDYTVHGVIGIDPDDNIYVLDWWRRQTESDKWIEQLLDMMQHHKPMAWAEEKGQIEKSLGPFLLKRMRERNVNCTRRQFASTRDKVTRARSFQARMSMGKVYLPRNASWVGDLVSELLRFPAGKHDDQVDVLSLFGRMLDRFIPGRVPPKPRGPLEIRTPTWDELMEMQPKPDEDGWRPRI